MSKISGDISLMPVGDILMWVANRRLSVTITLRRESIERRFLIRAGSAVQAACSDPREYLGQHLINFGYIDEEHLQRAFVTQEQTRVPLGRVLVMVNDITEEQLLRVLLFKTRESLLEAFTWTHGTFRVSAEPSQGQELDVEMPVDLFEVHGEAQARALMWEEIRSVFPADGTRCDVLPHDGDSLGLLDRRLVQLLDEGRSIGDASLELHAMDFPIYARLYDLYNRRIVVPRLEELQEEPKAPRRAPSQAASAATFDLQQDLPPEATKGSSTDSRGSETLERLPSHPAGIHIVRPAKPSEAPGVNVPADADDPASNLRIALAGRNWDEALLLAERILQLDPLNAEAIAARRVADVQVKRRASERGEAEIELDVVPALLIERSQVASAHMSSKERYVLSRIDGARSLAQILSVSPLERTELLRIVRGFETRGLLQLHR